MARNDFEVPLSTEEQRFVLAEIIKSSSIDVEHIASFVKSNDVIPDWMNMELPRGRNMNQCIAAAEHFALSAPAYYQQYSNAQHSPHTYAAALRRPAPSMVLDHHYTAPQPMPPPYSHQVPLLPRLVNGTGQPQAHIQPAERPRAAAAAQPMPKKKRGRPSRADRDNRVLQAALPPHLMPRPSTEPRLIAPAISGAWPAGSHEMLPTSTQSSSRGKKRQRAASAETEPSAVGEGMTPGAGSSASAPERRD